MAWYLRLIAILFVVYALALIILALTLPRMRRR